MAIALALLVFVIVLGVAVYALGTRLNAGGHHGTLMQRIARPSGDNQEIMRAMPRLRAAQSRLGWLYRLDLTRKLEESLWQAGIYMRVRDVLLIMLAMFSAGMGIGALLWQDAAMSIAVASGFTTLPVIYVRLRRRWRLKAFVRQLPFALDLIKSSLEAGHSLMRGLQVVVAEFQDPIATEFRSVIEQSRLGLPMPRAMEEMLKRVPEEDLRLLVVAIRVQSEVGSSLAHIIGRLSDIVRTRQRIQAQIHSLTAQSRLSGWVMGALPIMVLGAFSVIQPSYSHTLFHDPSGIKILKIAGFLDLLAFVSIKKLLDVKF